MKTKLFKVLVGIIVLVIVAGLVACGNKSTLTLDGTTEKVSETLITQTTKTKQTSTKEISGKNETGEKPTTEKSDGKETQTSTNDEGQNENPAETPVEEPETVPPVQENYTCLFVIDGGGDVGCIFSGTLEFEEGYSVYDLLCMTGQNIDGSGTYIKAINGLREKDHGPMSGWMYTVNGDYVMASCGAYYPENGDTIYWYYQYDE